MMNFTDILFQNIPNVIETDQYMEDAQNQGPQK